MSYHHHRHSPNESPSSCPTLLKRASSSSILRGGGRQRRRGTWFVVSSCLAIALVLCHVLYIKNEASRILSDDSNKHISTSSTATTAALLLPSQNNSTAGGATSDKLRLSSRTKDTLPANTVNTATGMKSTTTASNSSPKKHTTTSQGSTASSSEVKAFSAPKGTSSSSSPTSSKLNSKSSSSLSSSEPIIVKTITHKASDYQQVEWKSFYEELWPRYNLPVWASKPYFFRKSNLPVRICLVHVGKAGGSSLGCSLGFQLHCNKEMKYPMGVLPSYTTNLIHNDVTDCDLHMDYYMFSLRNPLERIKSWYVYDKYKLGKLRYECPFKTLNDLAELGLKHQSTDECNRRAERAIRGEEKFGNHAYHNYRFYLSQVPSNATLAAIRTEHMLDDWNSMERVLGSKTVVKMLPERNINTRSNPDEKFLSDDSITLLCKYLCDEIQVYKELLVKAINLQPEHVAQSMDELRKSCPIEADLPACPK